MSFSIQRGSILESMFPLLYNRGRLLSLTPVEISDRTGMTLSGIHSAFYILKKKGLATSPSYGKYKLTKAGSEEGKRLFPESPEDDFMTEYLDTTEMSGIESEEAEIAKNMTVADSETPSLPAQIESQGEIDFQREYVRLSNRMIEFLTIQLRNRK